MSNGFDDPARAYAAKQGTKLTSLQEQNLRFAPADNLYDAIRADVASIGGIDFQPLSRHDEQEPPVNDIGENPFDE